MDDSLVVVLRMFERMMVVGFGGMAIYLGYRLFFHLPHQTDQQGEIELPGMKVVLSRVGPGVFFLIFGAFILVTNLHQGIETSTSKKSAPLDISNSGGGSAIHEAQFADNEEYNHWEETEHFAGATPVYPEGDVSQDRFIAIEDIGELNCIIYHMNRMGEPSYSVMSAFKRAKTAMLLPVWNADYWGESSQLTDPMQEISNELLAEVFNDVSTDCDTE
jgi:hypothetical protein